MRPIFKVRPSHPRCRLLHLHGIRLRLRPAASCEWPLQMRGSSKTSMWKCKKRPSIGGSVTFEEFKTGSKRLASRLCHPRWIHPRRSAHKPHREWKPHSLAAISLSRTNKGPQRTERVRSPLIGRHAQGKPPAVCRFEKPAQVVSGRPIWGINRLCLPRALSRETSTHSPAPFATEPPVSQENSR